jgi:hypothetical protein
LYRDILFKHPANIEFEVLTGATVKNMVFWLIKAVYFRDIPMFQRSISYLYSHSKLHAVRIQKTVFFVPNMVESATSPIMLSPRFGIVEELMQL